MWKSHPPSLVPVNQLAGLHQRFSLPTTAGDVPVGHVLSAKRQVIDSKDLENRPMSSRSNSNGYCLGNGGDGPVDCLR
jgi:hypothetical protein